MKKNIVITGSLAYDHIMRFPDKFANHILPEKIHMLNVAFNIDSLEIDFGGTAGNIAYNLALLGEKPTIYAVAGNDFDRYEARLKDFSLKTDDIKVLSDEKTAQAFVTTDLADNQITAFHGGAMFRAHEYPLMLLEKSLVIIAPNGPQAMTDHAKYCQKHQQTFIFDPGQAFNALSGDELVKSAHSSVALTVNDYEWELWKQKTGLNETQTLELTKNIIITLGEKGCEVIGRDEHFSLPAVTDLQIIDPTGCGDAFRAGVLHALSQGKSIKDGAKTGTVLASFCVEKQGTQNHVFDKKTFGERMKLITI